MSALVLKIIACVAMVLDHIGYVWNIVPLRIVGRLAFPLFVYLLYNGYRHTSSKWKYALRLALFALISQIPFNLLVSGRLWHDSGNVFFTLLAALLALWSVDGMRRHKVWRWVCWVPTVALCVLYIKGIMVSDYGAKGILMILAFYICDRKGMAWKILMTALFVCAVYYGHILSAGKTLVLCLMGAETMMPQLSDWERRQVWSACALPLIFLYNGQKGPSPKSKPLAKLCQLGFYLFYPIHMVILWLLSI